MEYKDYLVLLENSLDQKTSVFNKKLISTNYKILGTKLPYLRAVAREIIKNGDASVILNNNNFTYYEEILLYGFVLAGVKMDEDERIKIIDEYVDCFDNWSNVDSFCSSLKSVKNNKALYLNFIKKCIIDKNDFKVRVGVVLLMDYYIKEPNLHEILALALSAQNESYYIQMALAWMFATSFAFNYDETLNFMCEKKDAIDNFVLRKTISKCNDSFRISSEHKKEIKQLLS